MLPTILSAGRRRLVTLCTEGLSFSLKRSCPPDDQQASTLGRATIARILENVSFVRSSNRGSLYRPGLPGLEEGSRSLGGEGLLVLEDQATVLSYGESRNDWLELPVFGWKDVGMFKHTVKRRNVLQVPHIAQPQSGSAKGPRCRSYF